MADDQTEIRRILGTLSLEALRGFEAAARRLSFTAAAEELCLTQSAVSKQVKLLEQAVGRPLFVRNQRGLGLTADGRHLYEAARKVLATLEDAFQRVIVSARRTVALTVTPSFASLWLAPKLVHFHRQHPDLDVRVDASEACIELEKEGVDLAVRLCRPGHLEPNWKPLMRERVVLVAAPRVAERIETAADLMRLPRLVFQHPVERFPWMSWSQWFERLGLAPSLEQPTFQLTQYEDVVKAALEGAGVAIGRVPLVLAALRAGTLKVVLPQVQGDGLEYVLIESQSSATRAEVKALADWVRRELLADCMN